MSSSQLTNSYFSEGLFYHQPGMLVASQNVNGEVSPLLEPGLSTWRRSGGCALVGMSPKLDELGVNPMKIVRNSPQGVAELFLGG